MPEYISSISNEALSTLCEELKKNNYINPEDYNRFEVKRGLRNYDGTGVLAGLTRVCSVEGYYMDDGEKVPKQGRLIYRGINMNDIVENCEKECRFGYEEVVWLLIFGILPTKEQLKWFTELLAECRNLPEDFIEDMIMKAPSPDIMNKAARSVLALYSYDPNPDDISPENVLRQCIQLIAQMPVIMTSAYQVKRRVYDKKSMYFHQNKEELGTAESILRSIRPDKKFTDDEAKLLDICMIIHAEHGGGNNSTFSTRCVTSSGTDTYAAIASGIGSLKGPRHGGANIKVYKMLEDMKVNIADITNEGQVADYITKIMNKEANDHSGLVYGMGHAVYTLSDPRAVILRRYAEKFSKIHGREDEFRMLNLIEELTPELFAKHRGINKKICANVDLYSGLVYDMLGIPQELFTPIFMAARMAGWSAHRIEELTTGGRIIRPAYKNVTIPREYIPMSERTIRTKSVQAEYIPIEER